MDNILKNIWLRDETFKILPFTFIWEKLVMPKS